MLLTRREKKIMECVGKSIALRRDCDKGLTSGELIDKIEGAVNILIQVFEDENTAEQLSQWDESFYTFIK